MSTTGGVIADLLRHFWPPRSTLTLGAIPVIAHIINRQFKRERCQFIFRNTTFFFFGTNTNVVVPLSNETIVGKSHRTRVLTQFLFLRRRGPQRKLVGPDNNICAIPAQLRDGGFSGHSPPLQRTLPHDASVCSSCFRLHIFPKLSGTENLGARTDEEGPANVLFTMTHLLRCCPGTQQYQSTV